MFIFQSESDAIYCHAVSMADVVFICVCVCHKSIKKHTDIMVEVLVLLCNFVMGY